MIDRSDLDRYRKLGRKIDGLTARTPWNETFHGIVRELYSPDEAEVVVGMPYTLSPLDRISRLTGIDETRLQTILEGLCRKGLVMDIFNEKESRYYYMPSPLAVGIFEFTMMRTDGGLNRKEAARLFHEYFESVFPANFSHDEKISVMRVIPVEETVKPEEYIEFYDYEKVSSLIDGSYTFAIGPCSCRNEKHILGSKRCDAPLDGCSMFGIGADYMIRNDLARKVSKSEMIENFARSREHGLVFCAWNVRKSPLSICHCCKCCCNYLSGMNTFGYPNSVVTSSFLSSVDVGLCSGCGACVEVCPVNAAALISANDPAHPKRKVAMVDPEICIGCGVCVSRCARSAVVMAKRGQRVIHPETLFETTILGTLERGTLQNQIFDNPQSITHEFMRRLLGAFLRLSPVRKALMSDTLRSSFLSFMKFGAGLQGKGWITEL
ncbi:MAG TPA: 4Fe-4S binding protein [Deltaproteobacteria bacterium]|nr:4Fe-4S binding protein [Deltaproteobacteria bacterium]